MPVRRCVLPKIRKVDSLRIQFIPVPSIVLGLFSAVTANWNGKTDMIERLRSSTSVIKKGVMSRIELPSSWERSFHGQSDPMAERKPFVHEPCKPDGQFRKRIQEKRSAWLQDPRTLKDPILAPLVVTFFGHLVRKSILVVLGIKA